MNSIGKAVYYLIARKRNLVIIIFVIILGLEINF